MWNDSQRQVIEYNTFCNYKQLGYCANPKIVNTRIISGMLLCGEEKANQMQDKKNRVL